MNLAQRDWEDNNLSHLLAILDETKNYKNRGFEWDYWNRLCHLDLMTLKGHKEPIWSIAFSPDGKRIVTGSTDKTAKIWDSETAPQTPVRKDVPVKEAR
jgi:WD40 repeat protein